MKSLLSTRRDFVGALACAPFFAHAAQGWPSKPVRMIVPANPASPADAFIRAIADELGALLKQPVIIENRQGAQGAIGLQAVARAEPDGATFGLINLQSVAAAALKPDMPYNLATSFVPVTQLSWESPVIVVNPKLAARNLTELIAYLKSQKDPVAYGSAGSGTPSHLGMELLAREAGVKLLHIPQRGAGAAATDVAGGQTELALVGSAAATQLVKAGRLRAIAVSSDKRLNALPDVPTLAEAGLRNVDLRAWVGLVAPAKTDPQVVAGMHKAIADVLKIPKIAERIDALGSTPALSSPTQFAAFIRSEEQRWGRVVKEAGIKFE